MCKVTLKINIIYLVLLANWGCNFKNICQYVLGFFTAIVFVRLFQVKKKKKSILKYHNFEDFYDQK